MAPETHNPKNALSRNAIVKSLFETYESIYDIDVESSAYQCYHESDSFSELQIASSGKDFFHDLLKNIPKAIFEEDRDYVRSMLSKKTMVKVLSAEKYYSLVYRLMLDGKPVHHKIRATMEYLDGRPHILIGVRNVEETIRQEQLHTDALASMHQKERNHMEAILASAAGYLEINLTKDLVLERSPGLFAACCPPDIVMPDFNEFSKYSDLVKWIQDNLVVENSGRYSVVSDREYLLKCFEGGEKRVSVSFSSRTSQDGIIPCKTVFFLYRDNTSGDVLAFGVIYDLTEQRRRDREFQALEEELRISRIHNSTSQMQPHFLYNALGSIQEIMLDDPKYASELIGDFTLHLRACIRAMSSDAPLPFEQELENIKAYLNIEKMRFGNKLTVVYDIATSDFVILPLSIQPLVENAIRHGIYQRGPRGGTVNIRSRELKDAWVIEVEDDGVGFDINEYRKDLALGKRDSTGLKNIIFRLDKVMNANVDIQSTVGRGTKVIVSIPKGGFDQ